MSNSTVLTKICKRCLLSKPLEVFSPATTNRDGRSSWCRQCAAEDQAAKRLADPLLTRRSLLKSRYGLSLEQYEEMLETQGGVCAICKNPPKSLPLHVDHDHSCCPGKKTCGKCLRSLLCVHCNNFLGKLESPEVAKYYDYLSRWSR